MIVIGIDCGSQSTAGVLIKDGQPIAKAMTLTEFDAEIAATEVIKQLLKTAKVTDISEIRDIAVTGGGRDLVGFATEEVADSKALAYGTHYYFPEAEAVIDVGAEGSKAVKINPNGTVYQFEKNDRCAAGAGVFIENMARALEVSVYEMGPLSLKHTEEKPMNVQCVVFAESEVISMIHEKRTSENIAYSIHAGIVNRMMTMIRRLGKVKKYAFVGGGSLNEGLVQCMKQTLEGDLQVMPEHSMYIAALGAALSLLAKK